MSMKGFKAFGPELRIAMRDKSVGMGAIKKGENKKSYTEIYIGNIASEASVEKIQKFLGDINIISFKLSDRKKKGFAFANLPNMLEAEKAIEMYNNKVFMGYKLVVRLANNQDKKVEILSDMPELEDIDEGVITSQCDILNNQSSNSKMKITNNKKCFEDSINVQQDSNGLFSLCLNRKDFCFKSEKEVREKLSQFGSVSNVYFSSNSVVVKMPSKQQVINSFKALRQELNMSIGDDSLERNENKSHAKIYIGNIAVAASRAKILDFFGDVKIISLRLLNNKKKIFAFANLPTMLEAEKAIEMYNNKVFMGYKLVVRLANNQDKKAGILSEMPKLENIEDDDDIVSAFDGDDTLSSKSCNSKMISANMPQLEDIEPEKIDFCTNMKNCFEDSLNIQPDSSGLFSLCINRKDSYLKSENVIEKIFSQYGSVSSVSFTDDTIVVKMPSKQQAINSFKALGQELNMSIGNNSVDTNTMKRNQNKISGYAIIYIGNIAEKASRAKILNFFGDVKIISLRLLNNEKKIFAFANLPNMLEAEKAIEMYNNKVFMGYKLVVRLANNQASNTVCQSQCKDNNKSASRILVNDWISSQDNYPLKHNDPSTDFQDHLTLFVSNFPIGMSEKQLLSLFQDFHASNVNIINNNNPKRSTQALVNFPSQKESEKAIYKFDKASYESRTLLVTSVGFCPCHDNQKPERKNKASSFTNSLPVSLCKGSRSLDKNMEYLNIVKHHQQQQGRNCQLTNSLTPVTANKKTFIEAPKTNSLRNGKLAEYNLQMEEENQQLKIFQFDEHFKAEAAKMTILVKNFQIQPYLGSSSEICQVMITSVINNKLFWGNIFNSFNSDLTDFMVLHNELQSAAMSWPKYILSKKEMKCVALYQGEWYRAWVLNSVEKDMVEVFFLDYGNISQIDLKYVRSSDESIWKLLPKARAFRIASNSKELPPNAENQFFDINICKSWNMANGFITVASLVSH